LEKFRKKKKRNPWWSFFSLSFSLCISRCNRQPTQRQRYLTSIHARSRTNYTGWKYRR
jgi:hypothetical protein